MSTRRGPCDVATVTIWRSFSRRAAPIRIVDVDEWNQLWATAGAGPVLLACTKLKALKSAKANADESQTHCRTRCRWHYSGRPRIMVPSSVFSLRSWMAK